MILVLTTMTNREMGHINTAIHWSTFHAGITNAEPVEVVAVAEGEVVQGYLCNSKTKQAMRNFKLTQKIMVKPGDVISFPAGALLVDLG